MNTLTAEEISQKAQTVHDAEDGAPKRLAAAEFAKTIGGNYSLASFNEAANCLREHGFHDEAHLVERMSLDCD